MIAAPWQGGDRMPSVVVVGAQWGDEGKGKVTDFLARQADVVVRYQGGSNAGHTVHVNDQEFRLHLVPSGILYPGTICVIGNGVVVDPGALVDELDHLEARGVDTSGLRISDRAHIIFPYHHLLDAAEEEQKGELRLGTTRRGIGPSYADKAARTGLRMADLLDWPLFESLAMRNLQAKNNLLSRVYNLPTVDPGEILDNYRRYAERLQPYITDTSLLVNNALARGQSVVFEGAQGTMLDIDHGTYPYVTSSHPTAGGACIGAGIGPTRVDVVVGVVKAYTSRVGDGPFPTELTGELGTRLRERGGEYGTTTGRPRRVGWLDAVALRYAVRVSGIDAIAITKLDVLSGFDTVKIAVGYKYAGRVLTEVPASAGLMYRCEPVYEELPGFGGTLRDVRSMDDLPAQARAYLGRIQELLGVPIALVSIGSERAQTFSLIDLFAVRRMLSGL